MERTQFAGASGTGWRLKFQPEAWIRDEAVAVDCAGDDEWDIDDATALSALADAHSICPDLDFLRGHPNEPQWVREWRGPFTITLIAPDGEEVSHYDPWPRPS